MFLGTLYMQQVLGFSALVTGLAWMTASVTSLALAGLSQRIVTRTSAKLVMAFGMTLIGAGILWAAQAPANGNFWADLAGPFLISGAGTAFALQNLGGAIGVAVTSSIATAHSRTLASHGYATAAALSGGLQWAMWVCGLTGLAAIPVAFALIRGTRRAAVVTTARPQDQVTAAER